MEERWRYRPMGNERKSNKGKIGKGTFLYSARGHSHTNIIDFILLLLINLLKYYYREIEFIYCNSKNIYYVSINSHCYFSWHFCIRSSHILHYFIYYTQ